MMKIFSPHFQEIQSAILEREYDSKVESHCPCGSGPASFRCQECFISPPCCAKCLVDMHQHQPFHLIQEWTSTHFMRRTLESLGLTISLGHHRQHCPNAPSSQSVKQSGRHTTIVNTNGIQISRIEYCYCLSSATKPLQLIAAGLFPATMEQPDTAFTFEVLNDFHVHTLTSKKSAYDYFTALKKHTDSTFSHELSVRCIIQFPMLTQLPDTYSRISIVIVNSFGSLVSGGI
jgi:hypothetical protein